MWQQIPEIADPARVRRPLAGAIVAPLAAAAVLWWLGLRLPAVAVLVAAGLLAVLRVAAPAVATRVEGAVEAITRPLAAAVSWLVLAVLYFAVVAPIGLAIRLAGRDPLHSRPDPSAGSYLLRRPESAKPLHRRQFAREVAPVAAPTRRPVVRLLMVTAWAVVAGLAVNLALGLAWAGLDELRAADRPPDVRMRTEALAGAGWAERYFEELGAVESRWRPLLGMVRDDSSGEHVNVRGMVRASYEPAGTPPDAPRIFFLGGSTTFGIAQRDGQTIPSHVARLAERDGLAVQVVNYGQGGWGIWQEIALLQQLVTAGEVPDLAVFYDGANEIAVQIDQDTTEPSYIRAPAIDVLIRPRTWSSVLKNLYGEYLEYSAVHRIVRSRPSLPPVNLDASDAARLADQAVSLHRRAVGIADALAADFGFDVAYFWQPTVFSKDAGEDEILSQPAVPRGGWAQVARLATERVAPPIVDLSDALDRVTEPVYIDRVHTNELGARVVAEAIYDHLRPWLEESQ